MSKNTASAAFRKIDVDAYNEDAYREEDEAETPGLGPDETEVTNLLNQNRQSDALKSALRNPPLKTRNQTIKDRAVQMVVRVLCAFKQSEIEKTVQLLDKDQQELLMKYIYKGFEFPQDNSSAVLLVWHEKVVQCCGLGAIVRVLTDRKRL